MMKLYTRKVWVGVYDEYHKDNDDDAADEDEEDADAWCGREHEQTIKRGGAEKCYIVIKYLCVL